jgi:hypothetical protein
MPATTTKRHPIRGFLYGIVFGLGLAFVAIGQKWAALGTWPPFILFLVGIVVGTLWSTFGPAKGPKGPAPAAPDAGPDPVPEAPATDVADPADPAATAGPGGDETGDTVDGVSEMR